MRFEEVVVEDSEVGIRRVDEEGVGSVFHGVGVKGMVGWGLCDAFRGQCFDVGCGIIIGTTVLMLCEDGLRSCNA